MSQVTINQAINCWVLCIQIDGQLIRSYSATKLIDVIGLATTLQLHITNIDELPLSQYLNQGDENGIKTVL